MSREHVSISELLHSLDSAELQEVEQVRATLNQQLNTGESTYQLCVVMNCGYLSGR